MGEPAKPVRRRIVPQQILSPTKSQFDAEGSQPAAAASQQQVEIGDLKEHSELATTLLGPGRKIYVDLAKFQRDQKPVDWKEVRYIMSVIHFNDLTACFYDHSRQPSPFPICSCSKNVESNQMVVPRMPSRMKLAKLKTGLLLRFVSRHPTLLPE